MSCDLTPANDVHLKADLTELGMIGSFSVSSRFCACGFVSIVQVFHTMRFGLPNFWIDVHGPFLASLELCVGGLVSVIEELFLPRSFLASGGPSAFKFGIVFARLCLIGFFLFTFWL